MAPSGTGLPLPGMPALKALIIAGLPRITAIAVALWLTATVSQVS
jgi:hypothetical protein